MHDMEPTQNVPLFVDGAYALSTEECFTAVKGSPRGLSPDDAAARLARVGTNRLPQAEPPGPLRIFLRQFLNPLVYVLLAASAISLVLGDWSDAAFIFAVLWVNATIGTTQEFGAARSAEALQSLAITKAYVLRGGEDLEVDSETLVPGDLSLLEAGSKVPADIRLVDGGIEVDESLLTGESLVVAKTWRERLPPETPIAERVNTAFAGTLVTRGRAHGLVVATGERTQLGRIASSLSTAPSTKPPLLLRMERFTRRIAVTVLGAVLILGVAAVSRGDSLGEVFLLAVALAVSAIPEGLPVALTVALAIGARRMGQRKVIARRLVAVEALGSCTFIASDKTGTLTLNELTVTRVALPGLNAFEVTGVGVSPAGEVLVFPEARPLLERLCRAGALCNDGFLGLKDGRWVHHGDAVDVALLALAEKAGVDHAAAEADRPRMSEIPFEAERRFAATLHRATDHLQVVVKGAGERVLPMCTSMATLAGDVPIDARRLESQAERLAAAGYRVLAIAAGRLDGPLHEQVGLEPEQLRGLVFLGFAGMLDPLRPEARRAILACQAAGIEVAMVTGDHPVTALAIARELGLANRHEQVVTGPQLAELTAKGNAAEDALVREARVFARVEPTQKLQIVRALIRLGHFVAVTGDGANDAPALRAAHIGVAMGQRGTDVARESAELILTDDNFASIVAGVEEGRIAYANVRKVIFLLISSGAAEVLLFLLTTAAGMPAPLWPVQLLWLNLVTNGIQDVALAFEPAEGGELDRPPRPPREPIFDRLMLERTVVSALFIGSAAFLAFRWMLSRDWSLPAAQNGVLLLLVLFENVQAGNSRSETRSLFQLGPLRNRLLLVGTLVAQGIHIAALYTPGLDRVLHLQPVSVRQWAATLALALLLLAVSEAHKWLLRRRGSARSP